MGETFAVSNFTVNVSPRKLILKGYLIITKSETAKVILQICLVSLYRESLNFPPIHVQLSTYTNKTHSLAHAPTRFIPTLESITVKITCQSKYIQELSLVDTLRICAPFAHMLTTMLTTQYSLNIFAQVYKSHILNQYTPNGHPRPVQCY